MIVVHGIEWLQALTTIPFNPGKLESGMRKSQKSIFSKIQQLSFINYEIFYSSNFV